MNSNTLFGQCLNEPTSNKHVFNHLRDNNIFTEHQFGFLPHDSTVCQLSYLYHTFCEAIDHGKEVRVIVCDVSKAFDRVWHRGLILKLHAVGISSSLLDWFEQYLYDRKQRVCLNGLYSNTFTIEAGVPLVPFLDHYYFSYTLMI